MKKFLPHIPLIIISGLMIHSIYIVSISNIIFSYEHYIGLVLILISIASLWYSPLISKLSVLVVLILAAFSQAAFTPVINRARIGFTIQGKGLDIVIQLYCLLLLILFIILHWSFLKGMLKAKR